MTEESPTPETPPSSGLRRLLWVDEAGRVKKLDSRERRFSVGACGLAIALPLVVAVPRLHDKVPKNAWPWSWFLVIALAMGLALTAATVIGRRALVGFTAFFVAFFWLQARVSVVGLLFLGLAGWLILRASRISREAAEARRAAGLDPRARARPSRRTRTSEPSRGRRRRGKAGDDEAGSRKAPEASKRYTPPKYKPPRPGRTPTG